MFVAPCMPGLAEECCLIYSAIHNMLQVSSTAVSLTRLDEIIRHCNLLKTQLRNSPASSTNGIDTPVVDDETNTNLAEGQHAADILLEAVHKRASAKALDGRNVEATLITCFNTNLFETFKKLTGRHAQQRLEVSILAYYFNLKWEQWYQTGRSFPEFVTHESADSNIMQGAITFGSKITRIERRSPGAGFLAAQAGEKFRRFSSDHVGTMVDTLSKNEALLEKASGLASIGTWVQDKLNGVSTGSQTTRRAYKRPSIHNCTADASEAQMTITQGRVIGSVHQSGDGAYLVGLTNEDIGTMSSDTTLHENHLTTQTQPWRSTECEDCTFVDFCSHSDMNLGIDPPVVDLNNHATASSRFPDFHAMDAPSHLDRPSPVTRHTQAFNTYSCHAIPEIHLFHGTIGSDPFCQSVPLV